MCQVKRQTTATPLQALVLLNDPQYIEASRALAERVLKRQPDGDTGARLIDMFRRLTSRPPDGSELGILTRLYQEQFKYFQANPESAERFLAIGDHQCDPGLDKLELAAWAAVAETLLSFDETVMRR